MTQGRADTRATFTGQFLESSAMFVRRARSIEDTANPQTDDATRCEHRGLICAVIMQCAAALETKAHEVCVHGPGAHLGSNGTDRQAQQFLLPVANIVDDQNTTSRFELTLHLLNNQQLGNGVERYVSQSRSRARAVSLDQQAEYLSAFGVR